MHAEATELYWLLNNSYCCFEIESKTHDKERERVEREKETENETYIEMKQNVKEIKAKKNTANFLFCFFFFCNCNGGCNSYNGRTNGIVLTGNGCCYLCCHFLFFIVCSYS